MSLDQHLSVREIKHTDIELLTDYWYGASAEFLKGMGADIGKLPSRDQMMAMLSKQIELPLDQKQSYALIWECDSKPVGHSNVNNIEFGKTATMHLHLWQSTYRKKGMGAELLRKSLPFYFEKLALETLICEPYALNPAPNKTLEKVGFSFVKRYQTVPGSINFMQEVNRWEITKQRYQPLAQ